MKSILSIPAAALGFAVFFAPANAEAEIVRRTSSSTVRTTGSAVTRSVRDETGSRDFLKEVRDVSNFAAGNCTTNCDSGIQMSEIRQLETSRSSFTENTQKNIDLRIDVTDVLDTFYLGTGHLGQP